MGDVLEEACTSTIIKVSNLSSLATTSILKELFEIIGPTKDLKICQSDKEENTQECVIEFVTPEAASTALHLTGTELIGRPMKVVSVTSMTDVQSTPLVSGPTNTSTNAQEGGKTPAYKNPNITPAIIQCDPVRAEEMARTIYMGNLPISITDDQLKEFLSSVGTLVHMKIAGENTASATGSGKYAFLEFATQEQAEEALKLNGVVLGDRTIRVNHSRNAIYKSVSRSAPRSSGNYDYKSRDSDRARYKYSKRAYSRDQEGDYKRRKHPSDPYRDHEPSSTSYRRHGRRHGSSSVSSGRSRSYSRSSVSSSCSSLSSKGRHKSAKDSHKVTASPKYGRRESSSEYEKRHRRSSNHDYEKHHSRSDKNGYKHSDKHSESRHLDGRHGSEKHREERRKEDRSKGERSSDDKYKESKSKKHSKSKEDRRREDKHKTEKHKEDKHKNHKNKEDRHKEDRHKEDKHEDKKHKEDKHKDDKHGDSKHKDDRHREDRHREDRNKDENYKEDRHRDHRHKDDNDSYRHSKSSKSRHSEKERKSYRGHNNEGEREKDRNRDGDPDHERDREKRGDKRKYPSKDSRDNDDNERAAKHKERRCDSSKKDEKTHSDSKKKSNGNGGDSEAQSE